MVRSRKVLSAVSRSSLTVAPAHRGIPRTRIIIDARIIFDGRRKTEPTSRYLERLAEEINSIPSAGRAHSQLDVAMKKGTHCIAAYDPRVDDDAPRGLYLIWCDGCYRLATDSTYDDADEMNKFNPLDMRFPTLLSALCFGFQWWDNPEIFFGETDEPKLNILDSQDWCFVAPLTK